MAIKKIRKIKNACALVALCHASGANEDTVRRICVSAGFDKKAGMADEEWLEAASDLNIPLKKLPIKPMRLGAFIKKYNEGLYLVCTFNHIFCVDGGLIFDPREKDRGHWPCLQRTIRDAWKVLQE